ncbi:MAG: diguanylate cyclase [Mariprofundaceae bacterium]|nr:diguanylate cyclase [Mariprofundaceae bacterium]
MTLSTYQRFFLSHLLVLLVFMLSAGFYFYDSAKQESMDSLRARLSNSAALLSHSFDVEILHKIRGEHAKETAEYQAYIQKIREFASSNDDIAFIYVMRYENDHIHFVLDSDVSKEAASPDDLYEGRPPELITGFSMVSADKEINIDKWGSFLSGYAPIANAQGHYLLGLDMRADEVLKKMTHLNQVAVISLLVCVLLSVIFSLLLARYFTRRFHVLVQQCMMVDSENGQVDHDVMVRGDDLDHLSHVLALMEQRVHETQTLNKKDKLTLEKAQETLKNVVSSRTHELAVANQKLRQEIEDRKKVEDNLERSVYSDYLTGLLNRRAMMRILEHEGKRTYQEDESFCLIFIDVDHFKQINDEHGHDIGDQVLMMVTEKLSNLMRSNDVLARWGGEEFLLLVPNTELSNASDIAESLRYALATHVFLYDAIELGLTASFGVSQHSDMSSLDDSIRMADAAMYDAKNQGRNCVVSFVEHRKKSRVETQGIHPTSL